MNDPKTSIDPLLGTDEETVFWKLSALLTGFSDIDRSLSNRYFEVLAEDYRSEIAQLCALYYETVRAHGDDALAALVRRIESEGPLIHAARQIATTWLLSEFEGKGENRKLVVAGHRERGRLWGLINAHPPSHSADRHGYWEAPPGQSGLG